MIEVENTDVNIVRNLIPMRNHMPASAYGLKAISDWFYFSFTEDIERCKDSKSCLVICKKLQYVSFFEKMH